MEVGAELLIFLADFGERGSDSVKLGHDGHYISKKNTLRQGRPMRLAHLAHITSIANQDATSI